jgi:hypothetical protein
MIVPVYDIANCGPRSRFVANGKLVHNSDSINFQNLPSRDKLKKTLKNSIRAPDSYTLINCDSSQIEARILAWLAGQNDIVEAFAQRRDVYCEDATKAFRRLITKADVMERFVGKTMRLGLGFGTGAAKLQHTLLTSPPGADLPLETCKGFVQVFRAENSKIVDLWAEGDRLLDVLASWPEGRLPFYFGQHGCLKILPDGIHLPNGLTIRYSNLRKETKPGDRRASWVHDSRKGPVHIWGGTVVENVVQALARIVVGQQMLEIQQAGYPVALTVHDAAVCAVPTSKLQQALTEITSIMSRPRPWTPGLPVACEATYGASYGGCQPAEEWAKRGGYLCAA